MARFCPLFSGSSGNSYYIGSAQEGILIDAGRSAKQISNMLDQCGIEISAVKAVFVTHEHSDHISGLRVFASRYHLPVFASAGTLNALDEMGCLNQKFSSSVIHSEGVECAGMAIKPFPIPHDSAECVGYKIKTGDDHIIAITTDLGFFPDSVLKELTGSDMVVLESNHDVGMLQNGPYPYPLKRRILSQKGHLSNTACSSALCLLAQGGTTRFVLVHLSQDNNTPELALQTSLCSLTMAGFQEGKDFKLYVAPKENTAGKLIVF